MASCPQVAARREMLEEIGTDRAELLQESSLWRSYDLPAELARPHVAWPLPRPEPRTGWRSASSAATPTSGSTGRTPEFSAWRWVPPDDLPRLIVPFKRDVYVSVVAEFRHLWA